jgi:uncharacterized protein
MSEFGKNMSVISITGIPPEKNVTAQMQKDEFCRQMGNELRLPKTKMDDWGDIFWFLSEHINKNSKTLILFDEITWMGSKDPTFLGKLKIAWDQYFSKYNNLIIILCGSISHWIEKNILNSTGFFGRISLDIQLDELPLQDCNNFWKSTRNISSFEKFKILSITGGVPRYLEEMVPKFTAEENIKKSCYNKNGFLFKEFDKIFSDLFSKRNEIYKQIVSFLAEKKGTLEDIYKVLNVKKRVV